jgi:hypothetical protein
MAQEMNVTMDAANLYREEIYSDRKIGTIRVMVPVTREGQADPARPTLYSGEVQIMTQMGPLPVPFEIEAKSLADAVAGYGDAAKDAVEKTVQELQELRRQQSTGLVLPGSAAMPGSGLPPGLGGGRGGKIQMP